MNLFKIFALITLTLWSCSVWYTYGEKKRLSRHHSNVEVLENTNLSNIQKYNLSDDFWQWEAQGRIRFIDHSMADPLFTLARKNTNFEEGNLKGFAEKIVHYQMIAYGMNTLLIPPKIVFTPLRGDANGFYMPIAKTIYLNNKMKWHGLGFERFAAVVLHENMHHILTNKYKTLTKEDKLYSDFKILALAALSPNILAQDEDSIQMINPQELVAYKTQRAARYVGILNANLTAWEMSARTQEIRVIQNNAGY